MVAAEGKKKNGGGGGGGKARERKEQSEKPPRQEESVDQVLTKWCSLSRGSLERDLSGLGLRLMLLPALSREQREPSLWQRRAQASSGGLGKSITAALPHQRLVSVVPSSSTSC